MMNRGEWHAVKKSKEAGEVHATARHYHFRCCRAPLGETDPLTFAELRQLRTIVQSSSNLENKAKERIIFFD